jgi:hypothetical protein
MDPSHFLIKVLIRLLNLINFPLNEDDCVLIFWE